MHFNVFIHEYALSNCFQDKLGITETVMTLIDEFITSIEENYLFDKPYPITLFLLRGIAE